jgi:non-ribosomal peptide synthase protein (TIGR01720 family)
LNPAGRQKLAQLPTAEICFNYWGQLDQELERHSDFERAPESCGPMLVGRRKRLHLLEVGVSIVRRRLGMGLTFSTNIHRRATIQALADDFTKALEEIVAHCQTDEAGGHTPSDFPLADINQEDFERLAARLGRANKST